MPELRPIEITISFSFVLSAAIVQGLAKYETDLAILDFERGPVLTLSTLDFISTAGIAVIFWIILAILIHLLLTILTKHGRFKDFLIYSGFGYLVIALSNLICYLLNNTLINKILVLKEEHTDPSLLLEQIRGIPVFQYMYFQSRMAELLYLLYCAFIIKKIYNTSVKVALFASFCPVVILYFFTYVFKTWLL